MFFLLLLRVHLQPSSHLTFKCHPWTVSLISMVSTTFQLKTDRYHLLPEPPSQQQTWFQYLLDSDPWTPLRCCKSACPPPSASHLFPLLSHPPTCPGCKPRATQTLLSSPPTLSQHPSPDDAKIVLLFLLCLSPLLPSGASHICSIAIAPELLSLKSLSPLQQRDFLKHMSLSKLP